MQDRNTALASLLLCHCSCYSFRGMFLYDSVIRAAALGGRFRRGGRPASARGGGGGVGREAAGGGPGAEVASLTAVLSRRSAGGGPGGGEVEPR